MKETPAYTQTGPRFSFCQGDNADEEMNKALRRCRASFFRNAYRFLNNEADAEDAVQDALLSAYKHIDQFRGEAQMSTWLTAIVSNSARMQLRKRQLRIHVSLDEPIDEEQEHTPSDSLTDGRPGPEDDYRESELHARVKGFVTQLSPPLRKTFELRALDGLTNNEAARILGVPNGTVKARLARVRAKLRRLMWREAGPQRRALQTYMTSRSCRQYSSSGRRGA
jgi:RNA polymerase sigma-70 factor, ECF subfamily